MTIADEDPLPEDAPLEERVAMMMRDRESGTVRIEDADGGVYTLDFEEGIRVAVRSTGPAHPFREPPPGLRAARIEQGMRLAEEIFRRSESAAKITSEEARAGLPPDAFRLDAFELLYRGVRARGKDSAPARALEGTERQFVLHRDADLDAFPLRPEERKIVGLLASLPRSLDDLRSRRLLPDDQLATFLHFLLVTHNAFLLGDDTRHLVPLGQLTPEERLLREPPPAADPMVPASVSRYGLALFGVALVPLAVPLTSDGRRPDAALFPRDTAAHWLCALAAAVTFLGVLLIVFNHGRARRRDLPLVALFTATAGSALLLLVQWLGGVLKDVQMVPLGLAGALGLLMISIVKLISFSYGAALDPRNGFFLSFVGFTVGVGLCEEVTKVLPVLDHFRKKGTLDLNGAISWGLASGIGLGVAEGLMYSSRHYNGVEGASTYLVRFTSCVALHGIWSAMAALAVYERRKELQPRPNMLDRVSTLLSVIAIPMVLHGLHDTLLKKQSNMLALVVALVSFGYLAVRIARAGSVAPAKGAS